MVPSLSSSHRTEVYNPKTFFLHAALLGQSFLHCPIFLTAASRRTHRRLGRPLPHQLSNETQAPLLPDLTPFTPRRCLPVVSCGISSRFQLLSPCSRQIAHVLLTRPPLCFEEQAPLSTVRLACFKHAASVRPEPGSNSNVKIYSLLLRLILC